MKLIDTFARMLGYERRTVTAPAMQQAEPQAAPAEALAIEGTQLLEPKRSEGDSPKIRRDISFAPRSDRQKVYEFLSSADYSEYSTRDIAQHLGVHHGTVAHVLSCINTNGSQKGVKRPRWTLSYLEDELGYVNGSTDPSVVRKSLKELLNDVRDGNISRTDASSWAKANPLRTDRNRDKSVGGRLYHSPKWGNYYHITMEISMSDWKLVDELSEKLWMTKDRVIVFALARYNFKRGVHLRQVSKPNGKAPLPPPRTYQHNPGDRIRL